jgi:protein transport protein SEC24
MIINPYAYYEGEVPVINYGEKEIPRCFSTACRAYLNPFVKWIDGGEKWVCNICKYINNTEEYFYGRLDKFGNRIDISEKADLSFGSYEFIANKTYMKDQKSLNPPTFFFLLDVSLAAIQNGFLSAVIESLKDVINNDTIPQQERAKVRIFL